MDITEIEKILKKTEKDQDKINELKREISLLERNIDELTEHNFGVKRNDLLSVTLFVKTILNIIKKTK